MKNNYMRHKQLSLLFGTEFKAELPLEINIKYEQLLVRLEMMEKIKVKARKCATPPKILAGSWQTMITNEWIGFRPGQHSTGRNPSPLSIQ